ncbi:unnamed protein product [Trifolium pratense]|uniref:Uncharacterized protein n=1 Tax=Trifolium pratense TaxID=57577 RepID=A0ACB0K841_TRIPR|nr:unnamed protein product [Trifolium pratense]
MAGGNNHQIPEHVEENNGQPMDYAPYHPQDGQFASVTEDSQGGQNMHDEPYNPEEPQIPVATPPQATSAMAIPPGAPVQNIMAALVNAINRQSDHILQQNQRFEQQNQRLESQSRRIEGNGASPPSSPFTHTCEEQILLQVTLTTSQKKREEDESEEKRGHISKLHPTEEALPEKGQSSSPPKTPIPGRKGQPPRPPLPKDPGTPSTGRSRETTGNGYLRWLDRSRRAHRESGGSPRVQKCTRLYQV